jgi:pimeloyl-ACP methyl ester carboxylesterase
MMTRIRIILAVAGLLAAGTATAGGEAGPISLRDQGFFWVGARPTKVEKGFVGFGPPAPGTAIVGQMYVGFQLAANKRHPYPLVLIHGGGGQATDWMGTPDGRDGWVDYFLAAGFDVYFVDRPGHGRSPNSRSYGELGNPATTEFIFNSFTTFSKQYPGGGGLTSKEVVQHTASSEPGPTVSQAVLKEDLAEMLDRIGPAIVVVHSNGGPSGWLAMEARPKLVKGLLAIEPGMGITDVLAPLITWLRVKRLQLWRSPPRVQASLPAPCSRKAMCTRCQPMAARKCCSWCRRSPRSSRPPCTARCIRLINSVLMRSSRGSRKTTASRAMAIS